MIDKPTNEEIHNDIWRMSKYYSMREILYQYREMGLFLSEADFIKIKYQC